CEGIAVTILAPHNHLKGLWRARAAPRFAPKSRNRRLKSETDVEAAFMVRLDKDDTHLLFFTREFVYQEKFFAHCHWGQQTDQRAAGVEHQGRSVLMEGANGVAPAIDENGNVKRFAFTRPKLFSGHRRACGNGGLGNGYGLGHSFCAALQR